MDTFKTNLEYWWFPIYEKQKIVPLELKDIVREFIFSMTQTTVYSRSLPFKLLRRLACV